MVDIRIYPAHAADALSSEILQKFLQMMPLWFFRMPADLFSGFKFAADDDCISQRSVSACLASLSPLAPLGRDGIMKAFITRSRAAFTAPLIYYAGLLNTPGRSARRRATSFDDIK